VAIVK